jgi:C-terminal processing protease CtpA/Prc
VVTANIQNNNLKEVGDINEIWNKTKKGVNEAVGNIGKEERPQRSSWFDEECHTILEDKKGAYNKMIHRKMRQNEQEYKDERKEAYKIFRQKKRVMFKSQLEKMETAYNNNEAKKFYQEVNSIRKGFKPQTLLIRDNAGNIISNKEKVLQRWSEYYEKHFELQDGIDSDCGKGGQCAYK